MNRLKEDTTTIAPPEAEKPAKAAKSKLLQATETQLSFGKNEISKAMPFIFFLALLAIVYIFNSNLTIKTIRKSDRIAKEIKEYRAEYISIKSEFMYKSKQSQVAKRLEGTGLKQLVEPPMKINFDPDNDEY